MKKMIMSLILALMLTLVPSCLFAANFIEIFRDDENTVFLDTSSIEDQGTYYKAWTKITYDTREAKKSAGKPYKTNQEVSYALLLHAYDKKNKRMGPLAAYGYGNDQKIIGSINVEKYPISWESVIPGSIGDLIIDAVYLFAGK